MRYGIQKTLDFYEIQRSHTASLSKKYERIFVYIFWRVKVPEMNVSDHDLSESFGIFEKSFLVVEISCCEYRKILDFPTFSRIWRSLICRQLQLCRRPPHMQNFPPPAAVYFDLGNFAFPTGTSVVIICEKQ